MTNAVEASRKRRNRVLAVAFVTVLLYLVAKEFGLFKPEFYERFGTGSHAEVGLAYWLKYAGRVLLFAAVPAIIASLYKNR